ncbi:hypothetical protein [Dysgonomonas macrotermitis]|nr:hypothetical protein [Dysgonomonas macrotermitis]
MKKIVLLSVLIVICSTLKAQLTVGYSFGYATYNMGEMKDMLNSIQTTPPASTIGAKNMDDFPGNIYNSINVGYRIAKHEFGIKGEYHTTGGKLSKIDYSGSYEMKFILNGYKGSFYYRNYFYTFTSNKGKELFSLFGEIAPGVTFSQVKHTGYLIVEENTLDSEDDKFNANGISVLLQAGFKYHLTSNIGLQVVLGYDISSGSEFKELPYSPNINWSGVRLNGGITYSF